MSPMPTWIQTADADAAIGWLFQMVPPTLTRCCTQAGEAAAVGLITCGVMPSGIEAWAWRTPSKIQIRPNPIRSTRRPGGSGSAGAVRGAGADPAPADAATARRSCTVRSTFHAAMTIASSARTTRPWWRSIDWNAETIVVLFDWSPELIPGMSRRSPGSSVRRSPSGSARVPVVVSVRFVFP